MDITLQYFDGCPSWKTTDCHLETLVTQRSLDANVSYQLINTAVTQPNAASEALRPC